ncbi:Uma2 family endonuclease [Leptolyngbya sp. NIES-2104]|uniref:Uma2 family endonuclease n=1 Tax=Leptolyngbya sp. NIES-2104 TaxID=1552121 RepID=UPI0006ECBC1C|nr:Uma2 family endonuclease [Leptolyngbya sp. NIES-2104]GAP99351.1 predicted dioxygenase [Leptolyngbya sp. NIES-2104]
MTAEVMKRLFTVKQYHRMIETGILQEGDRVELIRGEIVEMAAIGTRHAAGVRRLNRLFYDKFGQQVLISPQNPVEVDEYSEPEPDIAVLRPRADFYVSAHPTPNDVFLLVEVSDSTIRYDRSVKIPLYAEDNITEAWIVDVNAELVEVYRQPSASGYQSLQTYRRGQSIELLAFPNVSITIDEILG